MATLTKIIITTILGLTLFSCNLDINIKSGVKGNGIVTEENRGITAPFNAIKASKNIDVYLAQSEDDTILIKADSNLHELIITEVVNGVLKIYAVKEIGHAASKKIVVHFKNISKITATAGCDVYSTRVINTDHLELITSSGSDMKLEVNTSHLNCKSSSGSDLRLSGQTNKLIAKASSGAAIKASNLQTISSEVNASSGADITIYTSKALVAKASNGGDIEYYGNPELVDKDISTSGSLKKK